MNKVLRKRVFREFKKNLFCYIALMVLIMASMYLVISMVGAAEVIIDGSAVYEEEDKLEDGFFITFTKLSETEKKKIESEDVELEEHFSIDIPVEDSSILRAFVVREKIDLLHLECGTLPKKDNQVVLEKRYCETKGYELKDSIKIADKDYQIVGICSTPDYNSPLKEISDTSVNSDGFGTAFFIKDEYERLVEEGAGYKAEEYLYAYKNNGSLSDNGLVEMIRDFDFDASLVEDEDFQDYWKHTGGKVDEIKDGLQDLEDGAKSLNKGLNTIDKSVSLAAQRQDGLATLSEAIGSANDGSKELLDGIEEMSTQASDIIDEYMSGSIANLSSFVKAADNPRVDAAAGDVELNKTAGLVSGIILMVLFTYVISVFITNMINEESSIIGALYALGAKRKDILAHYLTLPVIVCFAAGVLGTILAGSPLGVANQMKDSYAYFSLPEITPGIRGYLLVYGIVMPPVVAAIVNYFIIRKKLSRSALSLMRNEQKQGRVKGFRFPARLKFKTKFQLRQMLNEIRTSIAVVLGMLISLLLVMLAMNIMVMCTHYRDNSVEDTHFEYMYTIKYPEENVPKGGYEAYAKTLKSPEIFGYTFDTTVLGITYDNPFFELEFPTKKNEVVISSAMQTKYNLKVGDTVVLTDEETDRLYTFKVGGVSKYAGGMFCFMKIDDARELFDVDDTEYNVVFSDHELDIPTGILYSTLTKQQVADSADIFINTMKGMISTIMIVSIMIFAVVMYLMLGVMINRSAFNISLIKVFGYKSKDVKKLYLNGNLYVIAIGALICIPLAKKIMDSIYPYFVSNLACDINLSFPVWLYAAIYFGIVLLAIVMIQILVRKINKMVPADVLKNRE